MKCILDTNKINEYDNFISLGYYCDVAKDLEKMGLRDMSSPFDWVITSFDKVIEAIDTRFIDYLSYENLEQSINNRKNYHDKKYNVFYFHDFDQYKSLKSQYRNVFEKYNRRILRFLEKIKKPTLFIRYISCEKTNKNGQSEELSYIEKNIENIQKTIRKYNEKNDIIFIANENVKSNTIYIYNVNNDKNDIVSRSPILNNIELYNLLKDIEVKNRKENIKRYTKKEKVKKISKVINKIKKDIKKIVFKKYIHDKEYNILGK